MHFVKQKTPKYTLNISRDIEEKGMNKLNAIIIEGVNILRHKVGHEHGKFMPN